MVRTASAQTSQQELRPEPDGEHVVMAAAQDATLGKQSKLVFVFNFFDELRRVAPVKK
jgi:hypothetical protein